jgi:hypothetical protein
MLSSVPGKKYFRVFFLYIVIDLLSPCFGLFEGLEESEDRRPVDPEDLARASFVATSFQ